MERLSITYRDSAAMVRARDLMTPFADALKLRDQDDTQTAAGRLDHAGFESDLITIARKTPDVRQAIGYRSSTAFERAAGWLPDFRNAAVHPSRPLVERAEDVSRLIKGEELLRTLFEATCAQLFSRAPSSLTRW